MDREFKRKIVHTVAAVAAVPFLLFLPVWAGIVLTIIGLGVIAVVWRLEGRGEQVKGPAGQGQHLIARALENTMRPEERFPWAPFYFMAGLLGVATISEVADLPLSIAFAAYAVLGIGDTASALIGKAYGSLEIPWNPKKSWEGTGAGIGAAYPWAILLATTFYAWTDAIFPPHMYWVILVGTVVGMLVETLPGEDNFTIPFSSWVAMVLLAWPVGLL